MYNHTRERLNDTIDRLEDFKKRQKEFSEHQEEYRYFLYLGQSRKFGVIAFPKYKDTGMIKFRYNAPLLIELTVHEFFEYVYLFYAGNVPYWNNFNG